MSTKRQAFDHTLCPIKGFFDEGCLQFTAKMSANVTIDPIMEGRVVHVNSVGEYEMGATGSQMPIFLQQPSDAFDVAREASESMGYGVGGRQMTGLVATGGFELESTEYDAALSYANNDPIRGQTGNTVSATGGVLTNAGVVAGTNNICGIVSRGVITNANKKTALAFWTHFEIGTAGN